MTHCFKDVEIAHILIVRQAGILRVGCEATAHRGCRHSNLSRIGFGPLFWCLMDICY